MRFSYNQITSLRRDVSAKLSPKRYLHTLGVEKSACYIGRFFEEVDISELSVAALLHDITKEYSLAEHFELLKRHSIDTGLYDADVDAVLHSMTALYAVLEDFLQYATSNVLSAVKNHTLGSSDMSIFDEIIFIADYVEDGRTYPACIDVRESLYRDLKSSKSKDDLYRAIHCAVVKSLEYTIASLRARGNKVHEQTAVTLNAFTVKLNCYEEKL